MQKRNFGWPQALGILIIVGLMVAGAYTAVQLSPYLPNTFNRLAAAFTSLTQVFIPGERILLNVSPERVETENTAILSWIHRNKSEGGVYTLSYPCTTDSYLGVVISSGSKRLLCDTPSEVLSADSNLTLVAISEKEGVSEIPVTLSYSLPDENLPVITSSVTLSVVGSSTAKEKPVEEVAVSEEPESSPIIKDTQPVPKTPVAGQRTEKTYPLGTASTAPKVPVAYGKPDLAPRINAVGTISRTTNQFSATTTLRTSDRVAVKFEVENVGTADSGSWYFTAVLPTYPMHIFQSEGQQNLGPGDRIEFTIGFDQVEPDVDGRFVVNVDPTGSLSEANEGNNTATTSIKATTR